MEIQNLSCNQLIDKLQVIYQLSYRYDQTYQNLYHIQKKLLPPAEPKLTNELKGRFGGGFGLGIFLISTFLIGFRFMTILEILLFNIGWENEMTRFLFVLPVTVLAMLGTTVLGKNLINRLICKMNRKRTEDANLQNEKITIYNQQIEEEMKPLLQELKAIKNQYRSIGVTVPKRYSATATLKQILALLKDGRADSWSGAVNLYEEELSRQRMENDLRAIQNSQNRAMRQNNDMQQQMLANQQLTNILLAWNLSNTLWR